MIFGWAPKLNFNVPIRLSFKHRVIDDIVSFYEHDADLIYLGFRPNDSIILHKQYSQHYHFKYESILQNPRLAHLIPLIMSNQTQRVFTGMSPSYSGFTSFNSIFEGGNLDLVIKVGQDEYDLFMRVDSNTRGHFSWYNFTING